MLPPGADPTGKPPKWFKQWYWDFVHAFGDNKGCTKRCEAWWKLNENSQCPLTEIDLEDAQELLGETWGGYGKPDWYDIRKAARQASRPKDIVVGDCDLCNLGYVSVFLVYSQDGSPYYGSFRCCCPTGESQDYGSPVGRLFEAVRKSQPKTSGEVTAWLIGLGKEPVFRDWEEFCRAVGWPTTNEVDAKNRLYADQVRAISQCLAEGFSVEEVEDPDDGIPF